MFVKYYVLLFVGNTHISTLARAHQAPILQLNSLRLLHSIQLTTDHQRVALFRTRQSSYATPTFTIVYRATVA